jgi:2-aminoadipate transaminase
MWYACGRKMLLIAPELDNNSTVPLYRQVYVYIKELIRAGQLARGDRLPATRELAGQIGLNRATVTAAYELLETEGLIRSHVGRGSFVEGQPTERAPAVRWRDLFIESDAGSASAPQMSGGSVEISFATSRPSEDLFPLDAIRRTVKEVVDHGLAEILQLGSPTGYGPLRQYLHELGIGSGEMQPSDEIMVTNGCQQALDLLQRILITRGDTVAVEDPVYPGIQQVIARAGARLVGVPVGPNGIDVERLEATLALERPKMLIVTPNFQNPTGRTLPLGSREAILRLAREYGVVIAENDIYADLRYQGAHLPSLKELDASGRVIQLRSFSKISFPGLRVGWVTGPRPVIARLTDAKQWSDLHTDQLAQAVLWRFASSGRLEEHRQRVVEGGRRRLAATLDACGKHLPAGCKYSAPEGGMSLWLELPEPLDATALLPRAQDRGVAYLPGRVFAVNRPQNGALRLSFAGLSPGKIEKGLATLGELFRDELARAHEASRFDPAPALV